MDDYPIKVGSMLFTMVDPNPGHEVAYNRWYERDHFYGGCMIGPWLFAGRRWVAPRWLKDLRFPESNPVAQPVEAGSYLSIYWHLKDHEDEHGEWSGPQVRYLYANGRGFNERTHRHTNHYKFESAAYADDDGVPVELALDHQYAGLAVIFVEPVTHVARKELHEWLDAEAVPSLLAAGDVASVSTWSVRPRPPRAAPTAGASVQPAPGMPGGASLGTDGGSPDRLVQLAFLEADPTSVWEAFRGYAKTVDAGGVGKVTFAAPFLPTVVGTDTYTDQLR
jgi:hypothetical protein